MGHHEVSLGYPGACTVVFSTERSEVELHGNGRVAAMSRLGPEKVRGWNADVHYGNGDVKAEKVERERVASSEVKHNERNFKFLD